jgi:hypothetical protein
MRKRRPPTAEKIRNLAAASARNTEDGRETAMDSIRLQVKAFQALLDCLETVAESRNLIDSRHHIAP